jgi:hypothetical protein
MAETHVFFNNYIKKSCDSYMLIKKIMCLLSHAKKHVAVLTIKLLHIKGHMTTEVKLLFVTQNYIFVPLL